MRLHLNRDALTAEYAGRTVPLLPKEFALLAYLLRHEGRTLTREQLLDGVWPLEAPTDRTIDDHVYRLRRKLAPFAHLIKLETVRGVGYRLCGVASTKPDNPLMRSESFSAEMRGLVRTYLRYGRGEALLTLTRHQELFGFTLDPPMQAFLKLMTGQLRGVVCDAELPIEEKLFFLLLLYQTVDPLGNRPFVEAAVERKVMPEIWQTEIDRYNLPYMYMDWGEYDLALVKLHELQRDIHAHGWDGLIPYAANMEIEYFVRTRRWTEAERAVADMERTLAEFPYERERGLYLILKGLATYRRNRASAVDLVDEGLQVLRDSQFMPHLMNGVKLAADFAGEEGWPEAARYERQWEQLLQDTELEALEADIRKQLLDWLSSGQKTD